MCNILHSYTNMRFKFEIRNKVDNEAIDYFATFQEAEEALEEYVKGLLNNNPDNIPENEIYSLFEILEIIDITQS